MKLPNRISFSRIVIALLIVVILLFQLLSLQRVSKLLSYNNVL